MFAILLEACMQLDQAGYLLYSRCLAEMLVAVTVKPFLSSVFGLLSLVRCCLHLTQQILELF